MSELDLDAIKAQLRVINYRPDYRIAQWYRTDVPALVAEVERLRECLEPGKAPAIVAALFSEAERLGHSPHSAIHASTYLVREVERLRGEVDYLRSELDEAQCRT